MLSRKRTIVQSVYVGLIVLVVTAPWWVTVIRYHGFDPLLSAAGTGENSLAIFHILFFSFTEEPFMTVIAVLGIIGIIQRIIRRLSVPVMDDNSFSGGWAERDEFGFLSSLWLCSPLSGG